jgi:hypothetical protein
LTGSGLLDATVTLTGPAPAGGETIGLASVGTGVNGSILVPGGQTTGSTQISVTNVSALLGSVLETVFGSCPAIDAKVTLAP